MQIGVTPRASVTVGVSTAISRSPTLGMATCSAGLMVKAAVAVAAPVSTLAV